MRSLLRFAATRIGTTTYERLLAHSVLKENFAGLRSVPVFERREDLWALSLTDDPITYVEFGVHEGDSIKHFAKINSNKDSTFIGLDSFEGLPEDWGRMPKGSFDTKDLSINNSVNSLAPENFFGGVQSCSSSRRETNGGTD